MQMIYDLDYFIHVILCGDKSNFAFSLFFLFFFEKFVLTPTSQRYTPKQKWLHKLSAEYKWKMQGLLLKISKNFTMATINILPDTGPLW
jgi:hypothetical protein